VSVQILDPQSKRQFPRRRFHRPVGLLFSGTYHVGAGVEIGEGGLSLNLPQTFTLDREAVVSFQLPGGSFISLRVVVRNANKAGPGNLWTIGCQYKDLKFEQKREIRSYVSARSANEN
jgi:hypothetical protein